eukprot:GHVS01026789.1.p1 GENE.GHVS01026789.1~~GHVS01026789.1.p1  ORF type:complete len:129 (-),score=5.81 GHVS01026789.1:43-429(-)
MFRKIEDGVKQTKLVVVYNEKDFSYGFSFGLGVKAVAPGQFAFYSYPHTYSGKVGSKSANAYFLQIEDLAKYGIMVFDSSSKITQTFSREVVAALARGAAKNVWMEITLEPVEAPGVQRMYAVKQFEG